MPSGNRVLIAFMILSWGTALLIPTSVRRSARSTWRFFMRYVQLDYKYITPRSALGYIHTKYVKLCGSIVLRAKNRKTGKRKLKTQQQFTRLMLPRAKPTSSSGARRVRCEHWLYRLRDSARSANNPPVTRKAIVTATITTALSIACSADACSRAGFDLPPLSHGYLLY